MRKKSKSKISFSPCCLFCQGSASVLSSQILCIPPWAACRGFYRGYSQHKAFPETSSPSQISPPHMWAFYSLEWILCLGTIWNISFFTDFGVCCLSCLSRFFPHPWLWAVFCLPYPGFPCGKSWAVGSAVPCAGLCGAVLVWHRVIPPLLSETTWQPVLGQPLGICTRCTLQKKKQNAETCFGSTRQINAELYKLHVY